MKSVSYTEIFLTISETCKEEVMALIGLLIFSGAMKNNHLNAKQMFDPIQYRETYRATMSYDRFLFLLDYLCFDDKQTRIDRKKFTHLLQYETFGRSLSLFVVPHILHLVIRLWMKNFWHLEEDADFECLFQINQPNMASS